MSTPAPFDWKSLITPAVTLGMKAVGDQLVPDAATQNARTNAATAQFDRETAVQKMGRSDAIRRSIMPGMYTNLGYSPAQGRTMAAAYPGSTSIPSAGVYTGPQGNQLGATQSGQPGIGSTIGKVALTTGLGMAPAAIGALVKSGAGKAAGSAISGGLSAIGGLPTLGAAAAVGLGALIWKKSQAHPTADKWVQGAQNPFDASWKAISDSNAPPAEKQSALAQSAQNYLTSLVEFAGQGGHNAEVARNASRTFRQYYGDPAKYGVNVPF